MVNLLCQDDDLVTVGSYPFLVTRRVHQDLAGCSRPHAKRYFQFLLRCVNQIVESVSRRFLNVVRYRTQAELDPTDAEQFTIDRAKQRFLRNLRKRRAHDVRTDNDVVDAEVCKQLRVRFISKLEHRVRPSLVVSALIGKSQQHAQ